MKDTLQFNFDSQNYRDMQFQLITELLAKVTTLQAFIAQHLLEMHPDKYTPELLQKWIDDKEMEISLNMKAELLKKYSH